MSAMSLSVEATYPLTPMQQGLLFHSLSAPHSGVYVAQLTCRLPRDVNLAALRHAWQAVLRRHEILRAGFVWDGDEPLHCVHRDIDCAIERHDWRDVTPAQMRAFLESDRQRGFDLAHPPLMRVAVCDVAEGERLLVWTHHHVLLDGYARMTLLKELAVLYDAYAGRSDAELPSPPRYGDYVEWLRRQDCSDAEGFWQGMLGTWQTSVPMSAVLGADDDRVRGEDARREVHLPPALESALRRTARANGVTVNIVLQAAWAVLLSRYTGQASVVFGVTRSCRRASFDGIASLVGVTINTLPHRVRVDANRPFTSILADLRAQHVAVRQHQHTPLLKIRQWSGLDPAAPLFDSVIVFEDSDLADHLQAERRSLWQNGVHRVVQTHYGVTLAGYSRPALRLDICCHPGICSNEAARRLCDHLGVLLQGIAEHSQTAAGDLALTTAVERRRMLDEWNDTRRIVPDVPLHVLFERQVTRTPTAPAAVCEDETLSYAELNERANRLAHLLIELGMGPEMPVAVAMFRSLDLIVALLATMKAGAVYVPLDPHHPAERLVSMLDEVRAAGLLSTRGFTHALPTGTRHIVVDSPATAQALASSRTENPQDSDRTGALTPKNLAYIIFTSGSTGLPKGVAVPHAAIVNKICTIAPFLELDAETRFAATTAVSFDALLDQILCPLAVGGTCVVVPDKIRDEPLRFSAYVRRHAVSVLNGTPGLIQHLTSAGTVRVDTLMIGGDVFSTALASELWAGRYARRMLNMYGPTETCINASAYEVPPPAALSAMSIGAALGNYRLYVLDARLNPAAVGVAGELYIGGLGLARGYCNRMSLTAQRFVADPYGDAGARMYKTGDRAKWRADGTLEFVGRVDRQLKVRGVRIEPAEIEHALDRHPAVERAIVTATRTESGEARLTAYLVAVGGAQASEEELRQFLMRKLPPSMIPDSFVYLDSLPLTRLGKVDLAALPLPTPSPLRVSRTPEEEILCELFAEVLGRTRVGLDENFFALGGHSLLATRLVSRIRSVLRAEVAIATVFEAPTVAGLAARLRHARPARPPVTRRLRAATLPLSYPQQRLWFIDQLQGASPEYNVTVALRLRGSLNQHALRQAVQTIVERHESLRTHFAIVDGAPVQVISPTVTIPFHVEDLRGTDERTQETRIRAAIAEGHAVPFELERGPLLRLRLLELAGDDHVLVRTCHHIVSDGWSRAVFNHELNVLYDAFCRGFDSPLPPLTVQYADFTLWQRAWLESGALDEGLSYWTTHLHGAPEQLALPTDRPRQGRRTFRAGRHDIVVPRELVTDLKRIGHDHHATLYMTLLAALGVLLARHSGQNDLVIGSPVANRRDTLLEALIGFFVNTLPLRVRVPARLTFSELLADVRCTALDGYRHQDVPFERVVEALNPQRSPGTTPVYQVMLLMQSIPVCPPDLAGLSAERLAEDLRAHYDVEVYVRERDGCLDMSWVYDADLFDAWRVDQMAHHYVQLLRSIVADPAQPVGGMRLVTPAERMQFLSSSTQTEHALSSPTLADMFEAQARRTPSTLAVLTSRCALSYGELAERASRLAHTLIADGAGPECVIGIALDRSADMVVSLLAVLLSGAAYLPLDPDYPIDRLRSMLDEASPLLVLSTRRLRLRLPASLAVRFLDDPAYVARLDRAASHPPTDTERSARLHPHHPAYLIFTSGSTGVPKAVVGLHQGAVNRLSWFADRFGFPTDAPVLARSSISFIDGSTELLGPLLHGGYVVVADDDDTRNVTRLIDLIGRHQVAMTTVVPSLLRGLLSDEWAGRLASCRRWITSGEPLSRADAARFAEVLPAATLLNLYGASEASGDSLFAECVGANPPIGTPIWNTQVYVLDAYLEPVPIGVTGELYVAGSGLARGYFRRPRLTAERFVADPFDPSGRRMYRTGDLVRWRTGGALEFVGRADRQVKVRGFRIELEEIESILRAHPAVADAVVVTEEHLGAARLAAFAILRQAQSVVADDLLHYLRQQLPAYMVPATMTFVEQWPLTPTGKLDRKSLPRPGVARGNSPPPLTPDERILCEIFSEVLGYDQVGRADDFFELGGHSLLALQLVNRIRSRMGLECAVASVFDAPSAARLAVLLRETDAVQR